MNLSQQDWIEQFEADSNAIMLDVRTQNEYNEGIIATCAVHLDIHQTNSFIAAIEALDKTKSYYIYCRSGMRSAKACEMMNQVGIENTYNLLGGILDWNEDIIIPE